MAVGTDALGFKGSANGHRGRPPLGPPGIGQFPWDVGVSIDVDVINSFLVQFLVELTLSMIISQQ